KMGAEGAILNMREDDGLPQTDRIPELNTLPRDVVGAGDSLLISSAMAMTAGATPWEAAYIGSVAAAVQVSRVGNVPLDRLDLVREFC
ncbi:uncharacterized protein METZ01_LOCUS496771, partial [marine metagenome]